MNDKQKLFKNLCEEMINGKIGDKAKVDCSKFDNCYYTCYSDCPLNTVDCDYITEKGQQVAQQYLTQLELQEQDNESNILSKVKNNERKDENMSKEKAIIKNLKKYTMEDIIKNPNKIFLVTDDLGHKVKYVGECFYHSTTIFSNDCSFYSLKEKQLLELSKKEFILEEDFNSYLSENYLKFLNIKDSGKIKEELENTIKQQADEINKLNNKISELTKDRDNYKKAYEDIKNKKNDNNVNVEVTVNGKDIDANENEINEILSTVANTTRNKLLALFD